jgi:hypothetical protein
MTVAETQVDDSFVGLNNAELNVPAQLATVGAHARSIGMLVLLGAIQVGWLGTLGYFAYVFVTS